MQKSKFPRPDASGEKEQKRIASAVIVGGELLPGVGRRVAQKKSARGAVERRSRAEKTSTSASAGASAGFGQGDEEIHDLHLVFLPPPF